MKILRLLPLADSALTLELAEGPGPLAMARVRAACRALDAAIEAGRIAGLQEAVGAFASVTLHYDPLLTGQAELAEAACALLAPLDPDETTANDAEAGTLWELPCLYGGPHGPDLAPLAAATGLSEAAIIAHHAAAPLTVLALGFLPGLPFLGEIPERLARPRRAEPRPKVPAGSVAIANRMCVIYPWDSPGGWHLIGHCPVPLFDIARSRPALLSLGDRVRFRPVGPEEHAALLRAVAQGGCDPARFRRAP